MLAFFSPFSEKKEVLTAVFPAVGWVGAAAAVTESQAWVRVAPVTQSCQLDLQHLPGIRPPLARSTVDPGPRPHHLLADGCGSLLPGLPASTLAAWFIPHPAAIAVSEHKPAPMTPVSQTCRPSPPQLGPPVLSVLKPHHCLL